MSNKTATLTFGGKSIEVDAEALLGLMMDAREYHVVAEEDMSAFPMGYEPWEHDFLRERQRTQSDIEDHLNMRFDEMLFRRSECS